MKFQSHETSRCNQEVVSFQIQIWKLEDIPGCNGVRVDSLNIMLF